MNIPSLPILWHEYILPRLRAQIYRWPAYLFQFVTASSYNRLTTAEAREYKSSDTLFVFGSGYSINDLTDEELEHFEAHNTLSFNWFLHQDKLRIDFHLIKEIYNFLEKGACPKEKRERLTTYFHLANTNPHYTNTIFLLQKGVKAIHANAGLAFKRLKPGAPIYRFKLVKEKPYPVDSPPTLNQVSSSLDICMNFGYMMGYTKIVLVGVDLYDRRYFWLKEDETRSDDAYRGANHTMTHNIGNEKMITYYKNSHDHLEKEGITLSVYNPKSLLTQVLPVYIPDPEIPKARQAK